MPPATLRRLHVASVQTGQIELDPAQAHHARQVLRLPDGSAVEIFDDAGNRAQGVLGYPDDGLAVVTITALRPRQQVDVAVSIASAVPKADRADWMVEKLSELGVSRWIPLATERSVVLPTGAGKRQRWLRIATESAKQSRRAGVMTIDELTPLKDVIAALAEQIAAAQPAGWVLSTGLEAKPISSLLTGRPPAELMLFVGPEGGWTDSELGQFAESGITAVRMGPTILRVETAAIAAAAIVSAWQNAPGDRPTLDATGS